MGKKTLIELSHLDGSIKQTFEIGHAERILKHKNGGWKITDENYTFKDGSITTTDKGSGKKSKEKASDTERNNPAKQD